MPQPDAYGKACGSATALGQLSAGQSQTRQGTIHTATVEDWFMVSFSAGSTLSLSVQNVSPAGDLGSDFQLEVYSACGLSMIAAAQGDESKHLTLGNNDPHTVFLCVRATRWEVRSCTFELTLSAAQSILRPTILPPRKPI